MALTACGTRDITQQLVIVPWTVAPAVTHLVNVETGRGRSASEESWTRQVLTAIFILVTHTVVHPVAACEHRETVLEISRTLKMSVWTGLIGAH